MTSRLGWPSKSCIVDPNHRLMRSPILGLSDFRYRTLIDWAAFARSLALASLGLALSVFAASASSLRAEAMAASSPPS